MRVFLPLHRDSKTFFKLLFENFDNFFVSFEWENKIEYLIEDGDLDEKAELGKDYPADLTSGFHRPGKQFQREHQIRMLLKQAIQRVVNRGKKIDIFGILACPVCKQKVRLAEDMKALLCGNCGLEFSIKNGIPIMLAEEATKV